MWSQKIESGKGTDVVTWNPVTHSVDDGSDGLPEIALTLSPNPALQQDCFIPLRFAATFASGDTSPSVNWMQNGVSQDDLKTLGLSQLSFPSTLPSCKLSRNECAETAEWLNGHIGQSFIVCLCSPTSAASMSSDSSSTSTNTTGSNVKLNRAVAARVMGCGVTPAGDVRILLQPCVLITSTADTSSSPTTPCNRYIYSVRLCN